MTTIELQTLIVAALVRRHGGTPRAWRLALGAIRVHDAASYPHCNWSAAPSGAPAQVERIERLLDDVRLRHPIVVAA